MVCMTTTECPKHGWRYPEEVDREGRCTQCGEKVSVGRSVKMSKSKRNVVEPSTLVEKYGADTARLFSLFAAPPEKDLDWSEQGVEGAFRFLGRVYRLVAPRTEALRAVAAAAPPPGEAAKPIRSVTHRTLRKVTGDIEERSHFNTAISAVMEMVNFLYLVPEEDWTGAETAPALKEAVDVLLLMLAPFAPHLAEELWERTGHERMICLERWPGVDAEAAREEQIEVVVQINGKLRSKMTVSPDADEETIRSAALADPRIVEHLSGKTIRKVVYVPRKLVSIVV
jgi:leucyl-tRNA synthetase